MKQESPLRKKDKYFEQIHRYLNRPTPAQLDARRRETDKAGCTCDDASQCWEPCGELGHSEEHVVISNQVNQVNQVNPIRDIAQAFVGGMGLGAAITALVALLTGHPEMFGTATLILVVCLLGYLYLDND